MFPSVIMEVRATGVHVVGVIQLLAAGRAEWNKKREGENFYAMPSFLAFRAE